VFVKQKLNKNNYSSGDELASSVSLTRAGNEILSETSCDARLIIDGKVWDKLQLLTDKDGKCNVRFKLPNKVIKDAYIQIHTEFQGVAETHSERIPILNKNVEMAVYLSSGGEGFVAGLKNKMVFLNLRVILWVI